MNDISNLFSEVPSNSRFQQNLLIKTYKGVLEL